MCRRTRDRGRHQEGLSPPGDEIPPGSQSGRSRSRREIQGGQGSLRGALGCAEARHLRSVRPRRGRGGRTRRRRPGFRGADAFSDIFGDVFGDIFGGAPPRRRALAGVSRRGSALRDRAGSGGGRVRPPRSRSTSRKLDEVRDLPRQRGGQGQQPGDLRYLRRQRPGARLAGLLPAAADLSALPRHGRDRAQSLRQLPGPGPRAAHQETVGEDSGRRRYRRSRTPGAARARPAATADRRAICTWRCTCASTRSSSATAST